MSDRWRPLVVGFVCGLALGGGVIQIAHHRVLQDKQTLERELDAAEATVDDLAQGNIDRAIRNWHASIELARMEREGSTAREIVDRARELLLEKQPAHGE